MRDLAEAQPPVPAGRFPHRFIQLQDRGRVAQDTDEVPMDFLMHDEDDLAFGVPVVDGHA